MLRLKLYKFLKKMKDPTLFLLEEFGIKQREITLSNNEIDSSLEEDDSDFDDDDDSEELNSDSDAEKNLPETEQDYEEPLADVVELFTDYIGLIISDYYTFDSDIFPASDLAAKILAEVKSGKTPEGKATVELIVTNLVGIPYAKVIITPTTTGQFIEKTESETPAFTSRFRIAFVGGDFIEYLDYKQQGKCVVERK